MPAGPGMGTGGGTAAGAQEERARQPRHATALACTIEQEGHQGEVSMRSIDSKAKLLVYNRSIATPVHNLQPPCSHIALTPPLLHSTPQALLTSVQVVI